MAPRLAGTEIAFLVANEGVEQVELTEPWAAVEGEGAHPILVAPEAGRVQAFDHLEAAGTFEVDLISDEADAERFSGLVLPGGVANPDRLRLHDRSMAFVRSFFELGTPVAAICHAPWVLIEAGVVAGRRITSWPSLRTDLDNAGALWLDEEVVVDRDGRAVLVTSRKPADLAAFCVEALDAFATAGVPR
jgi:protease I